MKVKRVGIVGAGVMGSGIAHLVARATKCQVMLTDVSEDVLAKASAYHRKYVQRMSKRKDVDSDLARSVLERVKTSLNMEDLRDSQIVIECVTERLETKKKIFRQLEKVVAADAILASGTSSLSITAISMAVDDPSRVIGLHFTNPAPIIKPSTMASSGCNRSHPGLPQALRRHIHGIRERTGRRPTRSPVLHWLRPRRPSWD